MTSKDTPTYLSRHSAPPELGGALVSVAIDEKSMYFHSNSTRFSIENFNEFHMKFSGMFTQIDGSPSSEGVESRDRYAEMSGKAILSTGITPETLMAV